MPHDERRTAPSTQHKERSTALTISSIGIVGAGTMGAGIAQVFAQSGFQVCVVDVSNAALEDARRQLGDGAE